MYVKLSVLYVLVHSRRHANTTQEYRECRGVNLWYIDRYMTQLPAVDVGRL